jgi:hypothetical protein
MVVAPTDPQSVIARSDSRSVVAVLDLRTLKTQVDPRGSSRISRTLTLARASLGWTLGTDSPEQSVIYGARESRYRWRSPTVSGPAPVRGITEDLVRWSCSPPGIHKQCGRRIVLQRASGPALTRSDPR